MTIVCIPVISLEVCECQETLLYLGDAMHTYRPEWLCLYFRGILSVAWCPQDSDLLLTAAKDNRVLCWNPNSTEPGGEVSTECNGVHELLTLLLCSHNCFVEASLLSSSNICSMFPPIDKLFISSTISHPQKILLNKLLFPKCVTVKSFPF